MKCRKYKLFKAKQSDELVILVFRGQLLTQRLTKGHLMSINTQLYKLEITYFLIKDNFSRKMVSI